MEFHKVQALVDSFSNPKHMNTNLFQQAEKRNRKLVSFTENIGLLEDAAK